MEGADPNPSARHDQDFVGEADGYVADVEVSDEQPAPDVRT